MKKKKTAQSDNLKMVVVFIIFTIFLIIVSLSIKLIALYNKSLFDGVHKFTVLISSQNSKKLEIISFAPDTRSISVLKIKGDNIDPSITRVLSIPIDANILLKDSITDSNTLIKSKLQAMVFSYNTIKTNLTIIDLVRLWLFSVSVPKHDIATKEITFTKDNLETQKLFIDTSIIPQFFTDYTLSKEQLSIQIINGAGVNGLGNRLAKLISSMGGNVISVKTSDSILNNSDISYYKKDTYTVEKLSKFLNILKKELKEPALSDIVIVIGKDKIKDLSSKL